MSRPDRRWRPSDADRERYAGAISQAFAEGRIDAADMESRTALVYEATTIADLDALVDDMPAPPSAEPAPVRPPARRPAGAAAAALAGAIALVLILGAVVLGAIRDSGPDVPDLDPVPAAPPPAVEAPAPVEEPPPVDPVELPPIDTEKLDLFTIEGLAELWTVAGDTVPNNVTIRPDRATLLVRSSSERRALDTVEYSGGLLLPSEPFRDLADAEPDAEVFFSWADVTPQAVAAAIAGTPAAIDRPDVAVGYVIVDRRSDGQVTIRVYPDGDTGVGYVRWDAAGQRVVQVT